MLRTLCKAKSEDTGMTDHRDILHAVLADLRTTSRAGTIAQRIENAERNIAPAALATGERRRKRQQTDRAGRRRARQLGATIGYVNRAEIITRDKSTCHICGLVCKPHEIHLDHVIPLSKGGAHTADNLRVACSTCNLKKGALLPISDGVVYHPPASGSTAR